MDEGGSRLDATRVDPEKGGLSKAGKAGTASLAVCHWYGASFIAVREDMKVDLSLN